MKTTLMTLATLTTLLTSVPSYALVRMVDSCETPDGKYQVLVEDNQGIGPVRTSHLSAEVRDAGSDAVLASYPVTEDNPPIHSISFGHIEWKDTATDGKDFRLVGPSTNFRTISVYATLDNGQQIMEKNLKCSVFNGRVEGETSDQE
jgi:hypothetical protein